MTEAAIVKRCINKDWLRLNTSGRKGIKKAARDTRAKEEQKMKARVSRSFFAYDLQKGRVFSCGYCAIPAMKERLSPEVYNSGIYGWNYDGYLIGEYWILTGYRNYPGIPIPRNLIENFNRDAASFSAAELEEELHKLCEEASKQRSKK